MAFVSKVALDEGTAQGYGLRKPLVAVKGCREVGKRDLKLNDATPKMHVDPETYTVTADGDAWYALEVEDTAGRMAYSNPIWVDVVAQYPPPYRNIARTP